MKHTRLWLVSSFLLTLSLGFLLTRGDAQPNSVKQIAPGVWFREGDLQHEGHCNNAIIEMKDYLIIVDANFPSGARAVLADAKKVSSKPVKYVFDTHHHGDHLYGNAVWTQMGAVTIAYQGVADELKRYEPARWQSTAKQRKDVAELKRDTAEPPKETFTDSPHVMTDGARRVEFRFFGWAHTRGDGFVYLPKEKVLCTGDAIVNGPYNYTADGNIGNWPKVVDGAMKLDVEHVLPGHGPAGGKDVMSGQRAFMLELHKAVQAAVKSGKKLDDLVKKEDNKQITSIQLPDSVKNWVGPGLPAQVHDAYNEIANKKPIGDQPHQ
ncbi:MAG TPA: MBL fold metallo-hydrolase [Bryobacteraceae bacterium]|nr:MBL fold metallo-hydrolase [Bryobacteraceae bacterium]